MNESIGMLLVAAMGAAAIFVAMIIFGLAGPEPEFWGIVALAFSGGALAWAADAIRLRWFK